jgi:staphylococcal nuclease domain-containing protein 1
LQDKANIYHQPHAFESRDFLRRLLVGKVVHFRVLYKIPTGAAREYGIVSLPNKTSLPELAVAEGWVKIRDDAGRKDDSDESAAILEKLKVVEARAKADGKGVWGEGSGRVECEFELGDAKGFVEQHKGEAVDGRFHIRYHILGFSMCVLARLEGEG